MPYIGNNLATQFQAFATQTITGDGSTSYTLDRAVANGKELLVYINNVKQEEGSGKSYEASGTTITFSAAVASGDSCYLVYMGSAQQTVTAPDASIVSGQIANANLELPNTLDMNGNELILDADADTSITADTDDQIDIKIGGSDKITINSSGRVGVGTTDIDAPLDIVDGTEYIRIAQATTDDTTKTGGLAVRHRDNEEEDFNVINGVSGSSSNIVNIGGSDFIGSLNAATAISFFTAANRTTTDGTQRMTIDSNGNVLIGKSSAGTDAGCQLEATGTGNFSRAGDLPMVLNRGTNDGVIASIRQADSQEGTIEVSGSTVSYNGFSGLHESSGIPTNTPIGTVVSTIDELDVYHAKQHGSMGEEDNPKAGQTRADHAKVEVSDTVGDSAVYGVVGKFNEQGKVMVTSVGIGSVRVTGACAKGDLLESNGDGTAKVQSDDIVRSKTIGKVTIGNSNTGVKLVSCVLYCG